MEPGGSLVHLTGMEATAPECVSRPDDEMADFGLVFAAHHRRLYGLARLLAQNSTVAEDVVATAFARTFVPWSEGRVEDVGAYLRAAVVNGVREWGRTTAFRRERDALLNPVVAVEDGSDQLADRVLLLAALDQLPRVSREVVVLRYFGQCSLAETAALLGLKPGTVKSRSAHALERLRSILGEDYG